MLGKGCSPSTQGLAALLEQAGPASAQHHNTSLVKGSKG